jgi:hypothetical protein
MIDNDGIAGHRLFINRVIARIASDGDVVEEMVQLYSLVENLFYEERSAAAGHLNKAIRYLKLSKESAPDEPKYRLLAVQSLNRAILELPQVEV